MERDIRPMKAEDMMYIITSGTTELGLESYGQKELWELAYKREKESSFAGFVNGECIGVGGIEHLWKGVGEAWIILSPDVSKYPLSTYIVLKDGLRQLIEDNELFRIQSWVRVGFDKAHSLMKHLGFEPEGTARKYTPDKVDCELYAIVRD